MEEFFEEVSGGESFARGLIKDFTVYHIWDYEGRGKFLERGR